MLLYCVQDRTLTLYCQLLNHVMEKLLSSPTTWRTTWPLQSTASGSSFYIQQRSQPQTNNVTEGGEVCEAMHEDYRNHPYQPLTLTPDQQQQIEEDLVLMTRKGVYPYE